MDVQQVSYRVRCPVCGCDDAQLRVAYTAGPGSRPIPVSFSCREQTEKGHTRPTAEQLVAMIDHIVAGD